MQISGDLRIELAQTVKRAKNPLYFAQLFLLF